MSVTLLNPLGEIVQSPTPIAILRKTADIHKKIYINIEDTAGKFATSPPTLINQLEDDPCCKKHPPKKVNLGKNKSSLLFKTHIRVFCVQKRVPQERDVTLEIIS